MAVKIVPKFSAWEISQLMKKQKENFEMVVVNRLRFIGEKFVKNARSTNTYKDRTGNLRSSIGYVVLKNGVQMFENFKSVNKGPDGEEKGKELANELSKNFPSGFVLICVAGMEYAAAVESKGFDVITGSSKIAEADLRKAVKELSNKLGKAK